MAENAPIVIVFGPTGAVGRAAAFRAHQEGAHVWLAMRDPKKPIPGLSANDEKAGRYSRVQADLSDPESVANAIKTSGARAAFFYIVHGGPDSMRATFEAMKQAGVTHVVMLSSYTIYPDIESALRKNRISAAHAGVEIALKESGLTYSAVRPMFFDSNLAREAAEFRKGEILVLKPQVKHDYIAPEDIGTVCGARLLRPSSDKGELESEIIPLCGPELIAQDEAWRRISKALDHDIKIREIGYDEYVKWMSTKIPEPIARLLGDLTVQRAAESVTKQYPPDLYKEASKNIKKYTGNEPTTLAEWAKIHRKSAFGL